MINPQFRQTEKLLFLLLGGAQRIATKSSIKAVIEALGGDM